VEVVRTFYFIPSLHSSGTLFDQLARGTKETFSPGALRLQQEVSRNHSIQVNDVLDLRNEFDLRSVLGT
jgi:hypothetical protein